jgi:large subunit ribosomal protein L29
MAKTAKKTKGPAADLRGRSTDDLRKEAEAKTLEVANLRFRQGSEKAADPMKILAIRHEVARIRTILRERELGIRGQGDTPGGKAAK